jgi:hypothetical protein
MGKILNVLVTLVLMVECGAIGPILLSKLALGPHAEWGLGTEHFVLALSGLQFVSGVIGFLAPGVVVWYLLKEERPWHITFRTLLIFAVLIAVLMINSLPRWRF